MWCDNCLLQGGAIALACLIFLYSMAGSIFLFIVGELLYFGFGSMPALESQIYGGIGVGAAMICVIAIIAITNNSYTWARVVCFLAPFILVIMIVRAALMIFRLDYYQGNVIWECNHGGMLYNETIANDPSYDLSQYDASNTMPSTICNAGFHTLYLAFAFALAIDCVLEGYLFFMVWRYKHKLEEYFHFKHAGGGYYAHSV